MPDVNAQDGKQSREVAESARQQAWEQPSFLKDLFLGRLRLDLLEALPPIHPDELERAGPFLARLRDLLERVDPDAIDRDGRIPDEVIDELREIGAFGIKIPEEYGGLGLSLRSYLMAMELVASRCGNIAALLSAHQSIGLPQPLLLFGTEEQKRKWLPRVAAGALSAFALTEEDAGSDPAGLKATATPQPDGSWILDGEKIWTTNGTRAELLVVMARTPDKVVGGKARKQITAFVVEAKWPGVSVQHRCSFMGLRALENGVLRFEKVRVPAENVLWGVGKGLKLALTTLNTGRLTIPASCVGAAKALLRVARNWAKERRQWGASIGEHEAIGRMLGRIAADVFAMEAVANAAGALADSHKADVRLEAAMAKLFNSAATWRIADDVLQIRGGRGYETAGSLGARGEAPLGVERALRDVRVNRIFEGSAEILHLFIAREALDHHLQTAFDVVNPEADFPSRMAALDRSVRFYPRWYAASFVPDQQALKRFGPLAAHAEWLEEATRRLGRSIFHSLVRFGPALEKRQAVLFRAVDIGAELFAVSASLVHARELAATGKPNAIDLADAFCAEARQRVEDLFRDLHGPRDRAFTDLARAAMQGELAWLDEDAVGLEAPRVDTHAARPSMGIELPPPNA